MSAHPNHYEILGLPPSATPEQIKKKYRELARRFHPDINSSPDAAQKILSVNQAYEILGDPKRRAAYDAERAARQSASQSRPSAQPYTPPRTRQPAGASEPKAGYDFNGFGRTYRHPASEVRTPRTTARSASPPRQRPDSQEKSIEQVLTEAKLAFINRQFQEAMRLCQAVLRINPREAVAHEILGDIYVRQGDTQRASTSFAYAIQFNPRNQSAQVKLEHLMHVHSRPSGGPTITFSTKSHNRPQPTAMSDGVLGAVTLLSVGVLAASAILVGAFPGNPSADGLGRLGLSLNLLGGLAAAGAASGVLLSFFGRMRPMAEELWGQGKNSSEPRPLVPLGMLLLLFSLVWFYVSFLAFIGMSTVRNRFSRSVLRAYAAAFSLVVLFSLLYHPAGPAAAGWQTTLLAGNLLFPSLLFGWFLGDVFRLRGRM